MDKNTSVKCDVYIEKTFFTNNTFSVAELAKCSNFQFHFITSESSIFHTLYSNVVLGTRLDSVMSVVDVMVELHVDTSGILHSHGTS